MPTTPSALAVLASTAALFLAACERDPAVPRPSGDAARGRALVAQFQCGRCHEIPGVPAANGKLAVSLASFAERSYIAGRIPNREAVLVAWLVDPPALVPGTAMPNLGVDAGQARDMAAFLATLE